MKKKFLMWLWVRHIIKAERRRERRHQPKKEMTEEQRQALFNLSTGFGFSGNPFLF